MFRKVLPKFSGQTPTVGKVIFYNITMFRVWELVEQITLVNFVHHQHIDKVH